ncbi:unnamed protein product [Chrysoparadoxa australica]
MDGIARAKRLSSVTPGSRPRRSSIRMTALLSGEAPAPDPFIITPEEREAYDLMYCEVGEEALVGLNGDEMKALYKLADKDRDGCLSLHEYRVAMHLLVCVRDRGLKLPASLPRGLKQSLTYIDSDHCDAVHTFGPSGVTLLNDARSAQKFTEGIRRLQPHLGPLEDSVDPSASAPSLALSSSAQTKKVIPRRVSMPELAKVYGKDNAEILPGGGRRTSVLHRAYEPAAKVLLKRVDKLAAAEEASEQEWRKGLERWGVIESGTLNLAREPLITEDFECLAELLKRNMPEFVVLDLNGAYLKDEDMKRVMQALAYNSQIQTLVMCDCFMTPKGANIVGEMIVVNHSIRNIDVKGCRGLGREGMEAILDAVNTVPRITSLSGIDIEFLKKGGSTLDLNGWELGVLESTVVGRMIRMRQNSIETIDVSKTGLTAEALLILVEGLASQTHIKRIDASQNALDERALWGIGLLLQRNMMLTSIDISQNVFFSSCYETSGRYLLSLLNQYPGILTFEVHGNRLSRMLEKEAQAKVAINRAVNMKPTFKEFLDQWGSKVQPEVTAADPSNAAVLRRVDEFFARQEGVIAPVLRMEQRQNFFSLLVKAGADIRAYLTRI